MPLSLLTQFIKIPERVETKVSFTGGAGVASAIVVSVVRGFLQNETS